jgi:hypothetical protein
MACSSRYFGDLNIVKVRNSDRLLNRQMLLSPKLSIGTISPSIYASFSLISPDYAMSFAKCYFFDFDLKLVRLGKGIKELGLSQS